MKKIIRKLIKNAIEKLQEKEKFSDFKIPEIKIDYPADKKFGEYSSNIAMVLAGVAKEEPIKIAEKIIRLLNKYIKEPSPLTPLPKGEGGKSIIFKNPINKQQTICCIFTKLSSNNL